MKIYTKQGDRGETSLIGGRRAPKNHPRVEAYGAIDELIAVIGIVRASETDSYYKQTVFDIQNNLMNIAAILASEGDNTKRLPEISDNDIATLEREIDRISESLPALKHFVIPGANLSESFAHLARSICRRAERVIVSMVEDGYSVPEPVSAYMNRLSDFLFIYARRLSGDAEKTELWIPKTR
jgi:cob(I)alamin adenosyltransferase